MIYVNGRYALGKLCNPEHDTTSYRETGRARRCAGNARSSGTSLGAPGLHGSAKMENPTKASTAPLRTIIAIAATSTMESRLRVKCHDALLRGIRATALIYGKRGGRARSSPTGRVKSIPTDGAAQRRISAARRGGDAHGVFIAAQNCSVTAVVSSVTFQPSLSAFSLANLSSI